MELQEIINSVNAFLVEEFEVDENTIQPEANLRDTLNLDSLDYIDLVVVIETNFHFKVQPDDFQHISTFQDFYHYIQKQIEKSKIS